jgi:hypothetical protein
MNRRSEITSWMLGLVLVVAAAGGAQPAGEDSASETPAAEIQRAYRSPMEGFALKPPAGAVRTDTQGPAVLAQWTMQDPQSGETLWTLRVYRTTFRNREANIRDYAQAVTETLTLREGMKIGDLTYMDVAGCPAIQITGGTKEQIVTDTTGIRSKLPATQLRQAWFLRGPGEFLVTEFAVVGNESERLNTTWENLLSSIELFDAKTFQLEQERNIKQAGVFLNHLTSEAVERALPRTPRWFLVYQSDKPVGWLCMQGRPARRNRIAGYEICSWAMFQLSDQPVRLIRQQQFADPKFSMGQWQGRIQIGSGEQSALLVEDGLRQGPLIVSTFHDGLRQTNVEKTIPRDVTGMYLPKAVGVLLPSLLDRTKTAAYTFAEYDRRKNDFQMRTVSVVGPERIDLRGKFVDAVRITDQPTADAEAVTFWVDETGRVLQSRSPDGFLRVSASQKDVLKVYPNARGVINQLNQTQPNKSAK